MQQSFELTNETGPAASLWHLEWDDQTFALKDPTGALFVTINTIRAHRLIEIAQLYADDKISITEKNVTVTFRKNRVASRAVRELIIQGLRTDVEYRLAQKAKARSRFPLGLGLFFGFGLAFAFYSWVLVELDRAHASVPAWIIGLGVVLHFVGIVFFGLMLAGFFLSYSSVRHYLRILQVERSLKTGP